eukprot:2777059-Pleurochrysis_carterae.AAC.1
MCLEPTSKRIYVSPHARFVETSFPGLTTPSPPPPSTTPPTMPYTVPPAAPIQTENEAIDANENTMLDDISAPSPPQDETDPRDTPDAVVNNYGEGTIADRILRRRRQTAA